jgi:hypothetical protein
MLKTITHSCTRKADILHCEGKSIVAKSPIRIASVLTNVVVASPFHGQITRDSSGEADLVAEMSKHPNALWVRVKAIEADIPNDNGDCFSWDEIIKSYRTFEGCPVFTNHENNKVENAKGKVIKADLDEKERAVYCTMFIDRDANPALCRAIEEGYVTDVSMGTQVDYSTCSICQKKAFVADDYCAHVKTMKGRNVDGRKVFENNYGLKFIEISVVTDGACKDCTIREVLDPDEYVVRVSNAVRAVKNALANKDAVKTALTKDGGQAEIQKLNQAMDLLEDVSRTMLGQRQFIDLEFMSQLVDVLADLQHVNDELVDQGYGRVGSEGQMQQQQMGIPPLPENTAPTTQEPAGEGPKPFMAGPTATGIGTVTEPTAASSGKEKVLLSTRIKDLEGKVAKIYEEHKLKLSGGDIPVEKNEKANQTVAKLAKIWENPSVKNYEGEFREGDFKVVFAGDEIVGLRGGTKVASLKRDELDEDVKQELKASPRQCAGHLLDSLKATFAGYAPTDTKAQQEMTMEAQLRTQKPPLHPRTNEVRESTTEDQLREKREGYDYHSRKEEARDSITEKQLKDGGYQGYDYHKRQDQPRDETHELQLRNEKWQGNVTPAGHEGEWAAGVKDQKEQITEGQLNDWKDSDKRHCPTDTTTEKQLRDDSENWGRRIASKDDARKALAAGYKAVAKTAIATGATPDEILSVINDMTSTADNRSAAEKAVSTLSSHKDARQATLRRAKFHGTSKTASINEVADYMLGSLGDSGMNGAVGFQVLETMANQKDAYSKIEEAITAGAAAQDDWVFTGSRSRDFLREVLAEESNHEEIKVVLKKSAIKADEADPEKFATAAFEVAAKQAALAGVEVTENVHVAMLDNGTVEVSMNGVKQAKKGDFGGKKAPPFGPGGKPAKKDEDKKDDDKDDDKKDDVTARKNARRKMVEAQVGGAMPDIGGAAPGATPGAGGGTTMPPPAPDAGAAAPMGAPPPAAALGAPPEEPAEEGGGEALPPGSICPVCGSDNVDMRHGEFDCNDCGASGEFSIKIEVNEWPGTVEDTEPKEGEGGEEEGGLGEMGGGAGLEMPPVGMAAAFRVTPEMIKIAGNKPIGSFCPHCGSSEVKLSGSKGCFNCKCKKCAKAYRVDTYVKPETNDLWGRIAWYDENSKKFLAEEKQAKKAAIAAKAKKNTLEAALRKEGLTAKFAKSDLSGKAKIISALADEGKLAKVKP